MRRTLTLLVTGLLLTPVVGCDSEEEGAAVCPGDPELLAFDLSATEVAAGDTIQATFEVDHFEFSMDGDGHDHEHLRGIGESVFREGEHGGHGEKGDSGCLVGHVHIYFDDLMTNPVAMQTHAEGDVVIPADAEPGEHKLIARLHNSDHTIIEPHVMMEQTITVQ